MSTGKRGVLTRIDRQAQDVPAATPPAPTVTIHLFGRQVRASCLVNPLTEHRDTVLAALRRYGIEVLPYGILFLARSSPELVRHALADVGIACRVADTITMNHAA